MAFGQQSGYPASARQVDQLTELVIAAGHDDLRGARYPLDLTQRQAAGKFSRDEADELIARLEAEAEAGAGNTSGAGDQPAPQRQTKVDRRYAEQKAALAEMPPELLAAELQQRGWIVAEP